MRWWFDRCCNKFLTRNKNRAMHCCCFCYYRDEAEFEKEDPKEYIAAEDEAQTELFF
jgi:hypothetical protein